MLSMTAVEDIFEDISGRTALLSNTEMKVLFEHLDPKAAKMIEPDRFIEFCSHPSTQAQLTEDKLRAYFRLLHRNRPDYREEFRQFDSENTGSLTRPEFRKALINCGMTVEGSSIEKRFRDGNNDFGMQDRSDENWSRNAPGKYIFNFSPLKLRNPTFDHSPCTNLFLPFHCRWGGYSYASKQR